MAYRCEATSVEGFVQQLVCYLPHGYWFYVTGSVPDGKDPRSVDVKLISKYGIDLSRQARARRKRAGFANLHYLRFDRFFVLLATHGNHRFFEDEADSIRDVRRIPIQFAGYSVSYKKGGHKRKGAQDESTIPDDSWHVRVQIGRERYRDLKGYFLELATNRPAEVLGRELHNLPFEPYAPVRQQLLNILRLVNKTRQSAGRERVPSDVLRFHRRIVRPFEPIESGANDTHATSNDLSL
jgi:hypothetical protein